MSNDKFNIDTIDIIDLSDAESTSTVATNAWDFSSNGSSSMWDSGFGPITISPLSVGGAADSITIGPAPSLTISNVGTSGAMLGSNGWSTQHAMSVDQSGQLELRGNNADIRVNGQSLMQTLQTIEERLNVLRPNTELEAEWDQLKELGDQYRKLETEFKEKSKMWNTLKSMPKPEVK
jgi:hypothetical protein